ncbi:serine hydrolase domain-containing protein [Marinihelvus fidelis]|nr:serine hydrolase domain-containing protein [Marinihelvus fidelis]
MIITAIAIAGFQVLFSPVVLAENTGAPAEPRLDADTVREWSDRYFQAALENHQLTGAVVGFVQGGELLFSRGYGAADIETGAPADPATTRVRIGSTTKTFTATIIAQLIQEGRIEGVDTPANRYLRRIQLPDNDGTVITLRHLLTHTAGFADRFWFIGADTPVPVPASAEVIESLRPEFARPAGTRVVYSNFGVATLGWIIEDITGQSMEEAMDERIFRPLGMRDTELPVDLAEPEGLGSPGYLDADGLAGPVPFTAINPAIAQTGSIVSTVKDMARYMNAYLGHDGDLGDGVRRAAWAVLAENASGQGRMGMTFFLQDWAGQRVISHGGNWPGFHTWMTLLPDQDAGFFMSILSEPAPESLTTRFLRAARPSLAPPPSAGIASAAATHDQFLAAVFGPRRPMPAAGLDGSPREIAGLYRADRRPFDTVEALSALVFFESPLQVQAADGGVSIAGAAPWRADGQGGWVFDAPTRPRFARMSAPETDQPVLVPDIGIFTFTRVPAWANPKWHAIAIHLLVPLTLLGLLALAWRAPRHRGWPRLGVVGVGIAGAVMTACATLALPAGETLMSSWFAGHATRVTVFVIAANGLLLSAIVTLLAVLSGRLRGGARLLAVTAGIAALAVAVLLLPYNVIGLPVFQG